MNLASGPGRVDYEVLVQIPPNSTPQPTSNVGTDEEADSDGVPDGDGNSVATGDLGRR